MGECAQDPDLVKASELLDEMMDGTSSIEEAGPNCRAARIEESFTAVQNQRTARLWMQYMNMVDILRKFIKAERTGNWELHLQAVRDMLPYFASSGNYYAKSAYLYLQMMNDFPQKHPEVYRSFQSGLHVVRRGDRYWAGLSTYLIIEQVLTRSVNT